MDINQIVQIIADPSSSEAKNSDVLALQAKYPYCNTFTLIALIKVKQDGTFGFEEHLEHNAHKVIDREVLHSYLNNNIAISEYAPEKIDLKVGIESETVLHANEVSIDPIQEISTSPETTEDIEPQLEKIIDPLIKVEEEYTEETIELNENAAHSEEKIEQQKKTLTELDFDIINQAIHSRITKEVDDLSALDEIQETNKELESEKELNPKEEGTEISLENQIIDTEPKSFISWLKTQNTLAGKEVVDVDKTDENSTNDILDRFITEDPRISKPKKEFFSPVKKGKESLAENPDLVTETLAKIYELQKNYTKAIEAYQKLSLIYPEKSTFFADRIRRIKDKENI